MHFDFRYESPSQAANIILKRMSETQEKTTDLAIELAFVGHAFFDQVCENLASSKELFIGTKLTINHAGTTRFI